MIHPHSVRAMCAAIAKDVADEYKDAFMGAKSYRIATRAHIDLLALPLDYSWNAQLQCAINYLRRDRVPEGGDFSQAFESAQINLPLEEIEKRIRLYYSRYEWEPT